MKVIELLSEQGSVVLRESGDELDGVGVAGEPPGRRRRRPMMHRNAQLGASGAKPRSGKSIFIVEASAEVGAMLMRTLKKAGDLTVCGSAVAAGKALPAIARVKPDLVLVDFDFAKASSLKWIKALRSVHRTVKLLVISAHKEARDAARALRWGADGYLVKEEDAAEIVCAVRDVLKGHIYVSEDVMESH